MYLRGQGGQRGYAMAALLVALGVMAVLMTAAMPVWRHESQRERELETIFRGQQIARSIAMYREKNGGNFPSSIDLLVQQRFLRKKYKDLFAEDGEWVPIGGGGTQTQRRPPGGQPGRGGPQPSRRHRSSPDNPDSRSVIMGVTLKDKGTAIVEYKRGTHHNEWAVPVLRRAVANRWIAGWTLPVRPDPGSPGAAAPAGPGRRTWRARSRRPGGRPRRRPWTRRWTRTRRAGRRLGPGGASPAPSHPGWRPGGSDLLHSLMTGGQAGGWRFSWDGVEFAATAACFWDHESRGSHRITLVFSPPRALRTAAGAPSRNARRPPPAASGGRATAQIRVIP